MADELPRRIALTGATGYLGQFVLRELLARGVEVRALIRPGRNRSGLPKGAEWLTGDFADPEAARHLVAGCDGLVHSAYQHVPGRYRGGEGDDLGLYCRANLTGSLELFRLAREAGVSRAVFVSSRAVYGRRLQGMPLDENHPSWPDSHYGAYKAAVEAFLSSWGAEGWPVSAIRPTGIYGIVAPLARSKWHDLLAGILAGEAVRPVRAGTEVHGADVARAILLLLAAPAEEVAGRAFNCSDLWVTTRDLAEIANRLTGQALPLPAASQALPHEAMETAALRRLGARFGGRPLLEATIADMIERIGRRRC